MDLKRAEEEAPGGAGEGPREEVFAREERDGHAGGEDGDEGCGEGEALELRKGVGVQFVDSVQGAPEVGDFVFEEAAGEGEDAVDGLGELEERRVVEGGWVEVEGEGREEMGWLRGFFADGRLGVAVGVEEGAGYEGEECQGESDEGDKSNGNKATQVRPW